MFIELTDISNKEKFFLRADLVTMMMRASDNKLATIVFTSIMSPQGYQKYAVLEGPLEVANAIAKAVGAPPRLALN